MIRNRPAQGGLISRHGRFADNIRRHVGADVTLDVDLADTVQLLGERFRETGQYHCSSGVVELFGVVRDHVEERERSEARVELGHE